MNTSQLMRAIKSDFEIHSLCLGVFASDQIPKRTAGCMIVNEEDSSKGGSHWIALFVLPDNKIEYFDSYGRAKMVPKIATFLKPFDVTRSKTQMQSNFSSCCGQHCLYYLWHRCRGLTFAEIMGTYGSNQQDNDSEVTEFVNDTFGLDTEPVDVEFTVQQICKVLTPT